METPTWNPPTKGGPLKWVLSTTTLKEPMARRTYEIREATEPALVTSGDVPAIAV